MDEMENSVQHWKLITVQGLEELMPQMAKGHRKGCLKMLEIPSALHVVFYDKK